MQSRWVCKVCKNEDETAYVSNTKECDKCKGECEERLDTGELVLRQEIPEYTLKDFIEIENENSKLLNSWMYQTENFFNLFNALNENLSKRKHLNNKMKLTIERGLRKAKLDKDKKVNWAYDPYSKTFVGLPKAKGGQ